MTGAAFLLSAEAAHGAPVTLSDGQEQMHALIERARAATGKRAAPSPAARPSRWQIGQAGLLAAVDGIAFLGEAAVALVRLPVQRRMLRYADLLRYADEAGVRALPLVLLMGFLIGLILAFQSEIPMRQFGADLYVVSLVSISLLRELGPLLTAVILAGRTGSAFAAEIGTMKVNEELDALATMGIDRMTMLVLPRLMAVMLVMPAMTLVLDLAGLAGMTVVMRAFGYPLMAVGNQIAAAATVSDLYGGLFKAVCFGATVAAIGCWQGLTTGVGPRAVGLSATGAVVGGIVATIVLDGLFALIFYQLNL
jgi:phospholipid/cholesterol/gamma-HCH transport system permease protein